MAKKRKKKLPVEVQVLRSLKGPCPFKANTLDRNRKAEASKKKCRKWNYRLDY